MLIHADLGARNQSVGDGEQPGFTIAMAAPIDWNGFQTKADRHQVSVGGNASLAQDGGAQHAAEPGRMLQHRQTAAHNQRKVSDDCYRRDTQPGDP